MAFQSLYIKDREGVSSEKWGPPDTYQYYYFVWNAGSAYEQLQNYIDQRGDAVYEYKKHLYFLGYSWPSKLNDEDENSRHSDVKFFLDNQRFRVIYLWFGPEVTVDDVFSWCKMEKVNIVEEKATYTDMQTGEVHTENWCKVYKGEGALQQAVKESGTWESFGYGEQWYIPDGIPEGFTLQEVRVMGDCLELLYRHSDGRELLFGWEKTMDQDRWEYEKDYHVDMVAKNWEVNGTDYVIYRRDISAYVKEGTTQYQILWQEDGQVFRLQTRNFAVKEEEVLPYARAARVEKNGDTLTVTSLRQGKSREEPVQ
jgi:hypothetical protein